MKTFAEIKKDLKANGIEVKKQLATINGQTAYRIYGSEKVNSDYLFTKEEIINDYYMANI